MDKLDRKELILKGNIYKAIAVISIPLMVNNFIHTLYNLADGFFVARGVGPVEFAATSFVSPVIMFFNALGQGIAVAGTTILSQLVGASKYEEANKYASQLFVISLIFSLCFTILGYWISPYIIGWMGGTSDLAYYSNIYLRICILGFPFIFISFVFNSILTSQGYTMISTTLSAISALINVILDPIFIFVFNQGLAGAAIATVISQSILVIGGLYVIRKYSTKIRPSFRNFYFDFTKLGRIGKVALPASVGQTGSSLGFMVLNSFIASYGTATLAGFALGNKITNLVMQPPMGIGMGLTTIIGQNFGADQMDRVEEAFKKAMKISAIFGLFGTFILFFFNGPLVRGFLGSNQDIETVSESITYLKYIAFAMPFMGFFSIFHGLFQGSGHTKYSMAMGIGRLWALRLPLIYIFKNFTNLGSTGIWIAMTLSNFLVCVYGYIVYKTDRWKEKVIAVNVKENTL